VLFRLRFALAKDFLVALSLAVALLTGLACGSSANPTIGDNAKKIDATLCAREAACNPNFSNTYKSTADCASSLSGAAQNPTSESNCKSTSACEDAINAADCTGVGTEILISEPSCSDCFAMKQ
jgi:hypothetical protein